MKINVLRVKLAVIGARLREVVQSLVRKAVPEEEPDKFDVVAIPLEGSAFLALSPNGRSFFIELSRGLPGPDRAQLLAVYTDLLLPYEIRAYAMYCLMNVGGVLRRDEARALEELQRGWNLPHKYYFDKFPPHYGLFVQLAACLFGTNEAKTWTYGGVLEDGIYVTKALHSFAERMSAALAKSEEQADHLALISAHLNLKRTLRMFEVGLEGQRNWIRDHFDVDQVQWLGYCDRTIEASLRKALSLGSIPDELAQQVNEVAPFCQTIIAEFQANRMIGTEEVLGRLRSSS